MTGTVYSTWSTPPPKPTEYPCWIAVRDHYSVREVLVKDEKQFYGLLFWHWSCSPMGHSQVGGSPTPGSQDSGVLHSTADALS